MPENEGVFPFSELAAFRLDGNLLHALLSAVRGSTDEIKDEKPIVFGVSKFQQLGNQNPNTNGGQLSPLDNYKDK